MANLIHQNSLLKKPVQKRLSLSLFFTLANVTLLSVGGLGIWSVEKQMKENLAAQLKIVLSGNLESLRVWAEGFKTYITKPVDMGKFRNMIEEELKSATNL